MKLFKKYCTIISDDAIRGRSSNYYIDPNKIVHSDIMYLNENNESVCCAFHVNEEFPFGDIYKFVWDDLELHSVTEKDIDEFIQNTDGIELINP